MEKMNGKLVTFTGIIVLVLLVAIFGFLFWEPKPEYIQGEAEATEVRISGKVPGRIEIFRFNEGEQVSRGDTVAILDSPEVLAKYSQAEAAEAAAQALNEKAERGTRSEQIVMTYQTWQKAKAAAEVAKKTYDRILKLYESEAAPAQKKDEAEANYKAMMATEQATYALVSYDRFKTGKTTLYNMSDRKKLYTESADKKSVEKANVTVADFGLVYDGTVKEPKVTVKYGDILLTEGVDYTKKFSNNVEAGNTAKVTIIGMGDYEGQTEKTFSIYSAEIEAADVAIDQTVFVADGKVKKPNVTVTHAGTTLKANTDYTVAFANNVLPGKATLTVTGKGKYTGKVVKYYTLNATHISKADITVLTEEYVTDGTEKTPAVSVAYNGKKLKSGTDYSVSYIDNVNAGTASVRISGIKYYSGSVEYTFEIKPIELTDAVVTDDTDDIVADGSKKTPTVNVTLGDTDLEAGKDFTVSYFSNVKVGTAKAAVTGIGNYTGKIKQAFEIKDGKTEITAASLEEGAVALEWKAVMAADSYAVYRKAESESEFAKIAETEELSYSDKTAKAGVSYEFEVRPVVGKSFGSSEAVKVAVLAAPAAKLTNTKAGIEVTWNASANADSYVVLRKTGTSDTWEKIADAVKTTYVY